MGKIKIMHLSDLHIGIKLMNYDLKEEQQYVFQQIIEYAKEERPDAVLIAGDIYDKSIPGAEAVELLDQFVTSLHEALPEGTDHDDQRQPRQPAAGRLLQRAFAQAEHSYGRDASQNTGRKN